MPHPVTTLLNAIQSADITLYKGEVFFEKEDIGDDAGAVAAKLEPLGINPHQEVELGVHMDGLATASGANDEAHIFEFQMRRPMVWIDLK